MLLPIKSANWWWKKVFARQLLCLLIIFSITLVAHAQTVKIIKAEYFLDTDPGFGLGTAISFTSSDTINVSPNIVLPALGSGYHVLYVRTLKDSLGFQTWGLTDSKKIYIGNTQNVQFFWDTDPGTGAGTIITTNLNDSINVSPNVTAPANAGWHTLYSRRVFQNANGTIVPTSITDSRIVLVAVPERIEYFWDTDPGVGNGTQISGPGNTIDSINVNYTIPTVGVAPGFHKLYIRRTGGGSFAGFTDVKDIKILGLTGGEYFIDTDPGVGNGIPFTLGTPTALPTEIGDTINANWNWVAGCIPPGPHNMYIRMKDGGLWSMTDSIAFTMMPDNPIITSKIPGPGPLGTPVKITGSNALAPYLYRQYPAGSFQADTIFLVANGSAVQFELKDSCGTLRQTPTLNTPATPLGYVSSNARGGTDLEGFRYMVFFRDSTNLNNTMVAVQDNNLWLGHVGVNTYFSSAAFATSFNTSKYLKRSFRIQTVYNPVGTKRVRLYISQAEFTALQTADPSSFPNGINSLTVTKYSGPQEDSLFNPLPGGNSIIIPNSAITIATVGAMYSLEFDVSGFSGFYIGGNNSNVNLCPGTTMSIPSNITGTAYQWQVDNGSGFTNISDGGNYSGTNTSSLTLVNVPTSFNKYKYRAVVTTPGGPVNSQVYTVRFTVSWTGNVSSAWENAANWSCGAMPDINTDVYINAGRPNNPTLNSTQSIRSLTLNPAATVTIAPGFRLNIQGP